MSDLTDNNDGLQVIDESKPGMMIIDDPVTCDRCGASHYDHGKDSNTTSWVSDDKGDLFCFDCCAVLDLEHFNETGKLFAYVKDLEFYTRKNKQGLHQWRGFNRTRESAVTTWIGRRLGRITSVGSIQDHPCPRGSYCQCRKVAVYATVAGIRCWGWYFFDSGDYVRLHKLKG